MKSIFYRSISVLFRHTALIALTLCLSSLAWSQSTPAQQDPLSNPAIDGNAVITDTDGNKFLIMKVAPAGTTDMTPFQADVMLKWITDASNVPIDNNGILRLSAVGDGASQIEILNTSNTVVTLPAEWSRDGQNNSYKRSADNSTIAPGSPLTWKVRYIVGTTAPKSVKLHLDYIGSSYDTTASNRADIRPTITLLPVVFKTYPDTETGPDKAHKKNLTTRQNETAQHGVGWEKVVCKIWDSSPGKVNLIDYLDGGPGNHSTYENGVKWKVNGTEQTAHELLLGDKPDTNKHTHFYVEVMPKNSSNTIDRLIITVVPPETKTKFDNWYATESTAAEKVWFAECPRMPSSLEVSPLQSPDRLFSPRIWRDPEAINTYFHSDAYYEIRAKKTPGGHGHQTTFGTTGGLILTSVSAGTADKAAAFPENLNWNLHVDADVTPFVWALQLDGNPCDQSTTTLTLPMLHEGTFIKKYMECRPPEPNAKPRFAPGGTP